MYSALVTLDITLSSLKERAYWRDRFIDAGFTPQETKRYGLTIRYSTGTADQLFHVLQNLGDCVQEAQQS